MNAFVDAAVILVLVGIALRAPEPGAGLLVAAPAACWIAVATPALVRGDLARRRLPNGLTLPALGLVVVSAAAALGWGAGGRDPAVALAVVCLVAVLGVVGVARGGVGMGDVKLGAALGGSTGLVDPGVLPVLAIVTGLSGLVAATVAASSARRSGTRAPPGEGTTIAYGPCLLAGYWFALASSAVMHGAGDW